MSMLTSTAAAKPAQAPAGNTDARQRPAIVSMTSNAQEWDAYLASHPEATVDHLWGWREVFSGVFGHECVYLVARREPDVVGVLPLVLFKSRLFGRFAVSVPFLNYGGLLANDSDAAVALLACAREIAVDFRASHVELRHVNARFPGLPSRSHKLGLVRALPGDVDALWSETDRKVRNQVRKAQKAGLSSVQGGAELVDDFYSVFARNMRDLGTPVYSRRLFEETLRLFPDLARVFLVRLGSQPVAAAIALRFKDVVLVPWASSIRESRTLCANMLLYWNMLERVTADGARVFDFGRSSPGTGTHQFKLQWGAQAFPLNWEYLLLDGDEAPNHGPSNPKFAAAIEGWKHLPLTLANGLGPWIVRNIP